MSSFVRFVLSAKDEDSAMGDVARDIIADPAINKRWSYARLITHLIQMGAVERVYVILQEANENYNRRHIVRRPPIE